MGIRDGQLQPDGARAWAVVVHGDRLGLTVFVQDHDAAVLLPGLAEYPEIALCFDRPTDSRACQLKGTFVSSRKGQAADRAAVLRQVAGFLEGLEAIGIPRTMTAGWTSWPCTALDVRITELYEQTPGPGAGDPLPTGTRP